MNEQQPCAVIGIEARELAPERAGVGRYLREVLRAVAKISSPAPRWKFVLFSPGVYCPHPLYLHVWLPFAAWRAGVDLLWLPSYQLPYTWLGRSLVTICDVSFERHPEWFSPRHRMAFRRFTRHAANRAETILTISEFSRREIIEVYGVPPEKVVAIPLGIDDRFQPPPPAASVAAETFLKGIGVGAEFLVMYGQVFNRRHPLEALQAFEQLAATRPGLQILLAGPDRTYPPLQIARAAESVNRRLGRPAVIRHSYIPEDLLPGVVARAKACVWLSEYEGFGFPPLEALFCGTVPIVAECQVRPETVGDYAVVVKNPGDIDEVAEAFRRALDDDSERRRVLRGREVLRPKFEWSVHAGILVRLLDRLV